jgi:asparagine synthase (glutamine-hydrolysing)
MTNNKIEAFQSVFEAALSDIAARTEASERCLILSGGVDTCAILEAAKALDITFVAAVTVITGDDSPDKGFAEAAAEEHGIPHHLLRLTPEDLVKDYLPTCIQILGTYDGMTLRNSIVVAAAFRKVSELGLKHAVVGDGADELFGGYSFMWGNADDPAQWKEKRDSMCAKWTFATAALAAHNGLVSHSPYTEPKTVEWAISSTERSDCIGVRPIRLVYGGEFKDHETGKIILREAYATESSWRRKDPIEVGSGITVIGHDPYWAEIISDEEFQSEADKMLPRGFVLKDKEQLVNFREFEKLFGPDGSSHPTKKRLAVGEGCVGCCFEIGDAMFCRMCGSYPAQRSKQ